jgi:gamma-glutamyltranspeptidase/glutathione hydrolase
MLQYTAFPQWRRSVPSEKLAMTHDWQRRDVLRLAGAGLAGLAVGAADAAPLPAARPGCVAGHPEGAQAGLEVLAAGGNAADAIVTAALVAAVVDIQMCGIGGYGGHMVIARHGGKRLVAIDYNTAAPRAARPDMFPLTATGQVRDAVNSVGWLAAGVPGTLAGMQLALDRHGTIPFRRAVQPALRYARDGIEVSAGVAAAVHATQKQLNRDPATARLLLPKGVPPARGSRLRNPDLAALLETLANDNSVEAFYRGDIARRIADEFKRHGGLVTAADLAAYRAREVEPLKLHWRGFWIHTAPLTAGGLSVLEALAILKALDWKPDDPCAARRRVEALRIAWHDRLRLLGDPEHGADVAARHLLSADYARQAAARVEQAVRHGRMVPAATDGRRAGGTIHLSAADADGNLAALTLTHGESFGARVTVDGLGLILGHGMSRFDPHPEHPNAPGPGKRPLHNMCPTIVCKGKVPVLALGARGGRRIPNTVFDVLTGFVGRQERIDEAVAAPRLHTEGGAQLSVEAGWPVAEVAYLRRVGYTVARGPGAVLHAVYRDPQTGEMVAKGR